VNEVDAVHMLDKLDYVAAFVAAAAIPHTFCRVDRKPIVAAAFRTGAAAIDAAAKMYPAPLDLAFDRRGAGFIRPGIEGV
jgi:hypothetical protein